MLTNLVEYFGVRGAEFAELWSLGDDYLCTLVSNYGDVYSLIFLFKWKARANDDSSGKDDAGGDNNGEWERRITPDRGRCTPQYVILQAGDLQRLHQPGHTLNPDQHRGSGGR